MRVLLINPWASELFPPPSLGYIQAALKVFNVDVVAKDLNEALNEKDDYDIIGVSFHSFSVKHARLIRDRFKGRLICGGHHPSALPEQMLSVGYNQVVIGEGENAIIDIINGNTDSIVHSSNNYFPDINSIPFPDYQGFSFSGDWGLPIISSRGCPFKCNFCASTHFWGHKYYARSADNVLAEIDRVKSMGYKTWMFEDDNFTLNKNRAHEICSGLDGKYEWQCASRAESLDDDLCRALYKAGCRTLWIGVESLSQRVLDRCNKNTTVEKMITGIKTAEKHGLGTNCQFIIGLPGSTIEDVQITSDTIRKYHIRHLAPTIAWVVPQTHVYDEAKKRGFKDDEYLETGAPYYTYEQDITTLMKWEKLI